MKPLRKNLFTLLNLHIVVIAALGIVSLVLAVHLLLAWNTLHTASPEQIQAEQTAYRTLDVQMRPLRGLPGKVGVARTQGDRFYTQRFPGAYSTISSAVGDLASANNVRLTRVSYTQAPVLPGLAEVRLDASLSGEYAPLMHFINGLERSKTFFIISGLTLTGQQGGMVNLRMRATTYLHAADVDRLAPPVENQSSGDAGEGSE